jgi:hypothetical protein
VILAGELISAHLSLSLLGLQTTIGVIHDSERVESVDRDKKDNLIERTTGYLNRQIERFCIVIQGSVNKAKSF